MTTASDVTKGYSASGFALLFLSGKSVGQTLALEPNSDLVFGRGKAAQIIIDDEKTSRRHSRLFFEDGALTIEDLGSSNGTLVNGKRVEKALLKDGDHIRIGNSVFQVTVEREVSSAAREWWERTQLERKPSKTTPKLIAGTLESIALVDLLQLLSTSQKSGVLVIEQDAGVGKIFLRDGQIHNASIDGRTAEQPEKTVYRLLRWKKGDFELTPDDATASGIINEPTQSLLLEGVRQADELGESVANPPDLQARVKLARPLPERLSGLAPNELDILQLVYEQGTVLGVLDTFQGTDADGYKLLADLNNRGLIVFE